jgi:hypothetical protein
MEKIIIETKDRSKLDLVKSMLEAMRIGFRVIEEKVAVSDNPSPSGDPYFANPKNLQEILRRKKEIEGGRVEPIILSDEELNQLLKAK